MSDNELKHFLNQNDDSTIKEYSKSLIDNLKDLNSREEKHNLWILLMFLLYFIISSSKIESLSLGPITIKDISIIVKILPLIFTYMLFSLRTISSQKRETIQALKFLYGKQFNLPPQNPIEKQIGIKPILRLYLPYSFLASLIKLYHKEPTKTEALIGFPILLPIIIIAIAPYIIIVFMLMDLWKNNANDFLGQSCFWLTIWLLILLLFYIVKSTLNENEEIKNSFYD